MTINNTERNLDKNFGDYGGSFVPETLMPALSELEESFKKFIQDEEFNTELKILQRDFVGRPTPLYFAENLTNKYGKANIYLKERIWLIQEHTDNNALGQGLIAKGSEKRIIAKLVLVNTV